MSQSTLPHDYVLVATIDLKKNHLLALILVVSSLIIMIAVLAIGLLLKPFPFGSNMGPLQIITLIIGQIFYIIIHELVHAMFMMMFVKAKIKFGLSVWAAYAGMPTAYFSKRHYMMIALAPVTLLGVALLIPLLLAALSGTQAWESWYWPLLLVQAINLGGSIGDYYVTLKLRKYPNSILVNDDGMSMRFYQPQSDSAIPEITGNAT